MEGSEEKGGTTPGHTPHPERHRPEVTAHSWVRASAGGVTRTEARTLATADEQTDSAKDEVRLSSSSRPRFTVPPVVRRALSTSRDSLRTRNRPTPPPPPL